MIDEKLCIENIVRGDEASLKILYSAFSSNVYNTLISYTKNAADAEELLQDVFITVFNKAHKFKFDSSVSTWIYRIAVNKALDFLRKKNSAKRQNVFISIYKKDTQEIRYDNTDFVHPGVKLENKENAKLLFAAIDELSDKQKTAFILTQIEGLPQAEVASIMETTRKSVESLLQRAKANLKKTLEKYFPERGRQDKKTSKAYE